MTMYPQSNEIARIAQVAPKANSPADESTGLSDQLIATISAQ